MVTGRKHIGNSAKNMKRPLIKDKSILSYIEYLEDKLSKYEKSPYVKSYLTVLGQINDWNDQLTIKKVNVEGIGEQTVGRVNLFAEASSKEFERAHKYFTEMKPYFEQLAYLRKLMTTEEKEEVNNNEKKPLSEESAENYLVKS